MVILALLLAGPRLMGMQVFTVLSGSMEPVYHTGSLIYVRDVDPMEIQPGQVIILTVGIVVSLFGMAAFVSGFQQRDALA